MTDHTVLRRRFLAGTGAAALAGMGAVDAEASPPQSAGPTLSVTKFGAVGDGTTDDTDAFLKALAEGRGKRVPISVPDGQYRLTRPLSIHAQGLIGNPWGSWVADVIALPVLLPESVDGPALTLEMGGSLSGIEIRYPNDDPARPVERPSAIRLGETGATVRCVKISHPWIGIDTVPVHTNPGRTVVENVFVNAPHKTGIHFTGAADVCLFRNIEVWTPPQTSSTFATEGVGFHFQRGDGIRLTDCFVLGADRGFLFTESDVNGPLAGVFTGYLSNCLSDFCNTGLEVRGDHRVTMTGGGLWSHGSSARLEAGQATFLASSVEMFSNADAAVRVTGAKDVVVQGCRIERPHADFVAPAVRIIGGDCINFSGNVLHSASETAIELDADSGRILMLGNIIDGELVDRSGADCVKQLEGNLVA